MIWLQTAAEQGGAAGACELSRIEACQQQEFGDVYSPLASFDAGNDTLRHGEPLGHVLLAQARVLTRSAEIGRAHV